MILKEWAKSSFSLLTTRIDTTLLPARNRFRLVLSRAPEARRLDHGLELRRAGVVHSEFDEFDSQHMRPLRQGRDLSKLGGLGRKLIATLRAEPARN